MHSFIVNCALIFPWKANKNTPGSITDEQTGIETRLILASPDVWLQNSSNVQSKNSYFIYIDICYYSGFEGTCPYYPITLLTLNIL